LVKCPTIVAIDFALVGSTRTVVGHFQMTRALAGTLLALAAVCCGREVPEPGGSRASSRLVTDGYAEPGSCAVCHADIAASYRTVAMARSFGRPDPADLIEDYTDRNRLDHGPSGLAYEMVRQGDRFLQRRSETGTAGRPGRTFDREVTFVIGSGRHARTYLHLDPGGEMTEMPVSWYTQERAWGMSPGFDRADQADFFRPITYTCLFCHNGLPPLPVASDSPILPQLFPRDLPSGIDCQRCHGPGDRHVRLARSRTSSFAEVRGSIVNPARLPRERQMDVCMQCHLETTSSANWSGLVAFGRGVFSFRPGQDLAAYRMHFDHPPGGGHDDKFEIAHQAYRLRQSACFRKSGRMTCTTCHDPHRRPADPAAYYASKCLGCHSMRECAPAQHRAGESGGTVNCAPCHMPARRTDDVVHVTMTDHFIQRTQPPESVLLAARREATGRYAGPIVFYRPEEVPEGRTKDLVLGVASVLDDVDRDRGLAILQDAIAALDPPTPEPHFQLGITLVSVGRAREAITVLQRAADLAPRNGRILLALGNAMEADGREDDALGAYARALAVRPDDPAAHTNAGRLLARHGRLQEALDHFDSAGRVGDVLALSNRGAILARLGRSAEAETALNEALLIKPGLAEASLELGALLLARGDPDGALAVLEDGAGRNPTHAALQARVAWILATSPRAGVRNGAVALQWAERAVTLSRRGDPRALDSLAAALAETGRMSEASRVAVEAGRAATAAGQTDLAQAIESRRRVYETGRPYREAMVNTGAARKGNP
jgi:Flp pilus assembly protein TadD